MAINIDTVYQRVLAIANKEQRGYINPQQFNLFANQVQFDIFEDYFFKLNAVEFSQKNDSQYNDVKKLVHEKIQAFDVTDALVTPISATTCTLPSDLYRLGEVIWDNDNSARTTTTSTGLSTNEVPAIPILIEEITKKELIQIQGSPLAQPTWFRPIFVRDQATAGGLSQVKIYPQADPYTVGSAVAKYFTETVAIDSDTTATVTNSATDADIVPGMTVTGSGIPSGTTVVSYDSGTFALVLSNAATNTASINATFISNRIRCNYIRRPNPVSWSYTEVNSTALYNSASSTDFELHESEENTLVIKILSLAGINIKDNELLQVAIAKEQQTK